MLSLKRLTGVSGWEDRTLAQEETHFAGAVSVPQRPFLARLQTAHLPLVGCTRRQALSHLLQYYHNEVWKGTPHFYCPAMQAVQFPDRQTGIAGRSKTGD